jgi:hypothetical protein
MLYTGVIFVSDCATGARFAHDPGRWPKRQRNNVNDSIGMIDHHGHTARLEHNVESQPDSSDQK